LYVREVLFLDSVEQAEALVKPRRVEVLRHFGEPRTCTQVGAELGESPQAVYYHVKRLQKAGLLELVEERRVRGITEGVYCATARTYWVSPQLVGRLGGPRAASEHLGLGYLLSLSEALQADLAQLASAPAVLPSFGVAGEVRLGPEQGAAFVADLQRAFQEVLERYAGGEGHPFRLALACYPRKLPQ
jgi:DNA-binding transcriptional ArsR family regulator